MSKKLSTKVHEFANFISITSNIDEIIVNEVLEAYGKALQIQLSTGDDVPIPEIGVLSVELKDKPFPNQIVFNIKPTQIYKRRLIQNIKSKGSLLLEKETEKISKILRKRYEEE